MDGIVAYVLSKGYADNTLIQSKDYTDTRIDSIIPGFDYKGSVATVADLPATGNVKGDCYNVEDNSGVYAWNGTSWGSASKIGPQGATGPQGPQGPKGEDGSNSVSVSATGTSINKVNYITIDNVESKISSLTNSNEQTLINSITNEGLGWKETVTTPVVSLSWDGVLEGHTYSGDDSFGFCNISSNVPERTDIIGGTMTAIINRTEEPLSYSATIESDDMVELSLMFDEEPEGISENDYMVTGAYHGWAHQLVMCVVHNTFVGTIEDTQYTFYKGINLFKMAYPGGAGYTTGLTYGGTRNIIHQIDEDYIPNSPTLKPMKDEWCGSDLTTEEAAELMFEDGVEAGEGYLGGVMWSDLSSLGIGNAEVKAFVIDSSIIQFEMTSSNVSPYAWFFNSAAGVWRSYLPVVDNTTSTSVKEALSAHMGKELQDQVNNLKNIGRFLSIWNASTGAPTSEPTVSPYSYKVGDYYRIGTAGTKNPAGNSTYTTGGTNWVEGDSLGVGDVVYVSNISGTTATWVRQTSGGGGTVQDVQINGTSIIDSGSGVANIPVANHTTFGVMKINGAFGLQITNGAAATVAASASEIEGKSNTYKPIVPSNLNTAVMEGLGNNSLTWTDAYKSSARNTIGACSLQEYTGTETSYEENVLYFTTD